MLRRPVDVEEVLVNVAAPLTGDTVTDAGRARPGSILAPVQSMFAPLLTPRPMEEMLQPGTVRRESV